jgi:ABC-type Fe3+ transport system substrate-binding protein
MQAIRPFLLAMLLGATSVDGVLAQTSPAPREPATLNELVKAAAQEGTLNVAWGNVYGAADGIHRIGDGIAKKFGVRLTINYSPVVNGAAFLNSIVQEVRAGQTPSSDIMFTIADGAQAKYAQSIDYRRYVPGLPAEVMAYGNRAVMVVNVLNAEEYNTKLVPRSKVPKRLTDLLKPEWKGRVATSPYVGIVASYLGLPDVLGHDRTMAFFKALSEQLGGIMTCGDSDRVVTGEFLFFGLDCGDYEVRLRQRKGLPIAAFYPQEGTAIRAFAPAVPLLSAHPNAARLFIAFLLTREGQDILWDVMAADSYRLHGSHMATIIADQRRAGVKFVENYGADVLHPELEGYQKEINAIVNVSH